MPNGLLQWYGGVHEIGNVLKVNSKASPYLPRNNSSNSRCRLFDRKKANYGDEKRKKVGVGYV